MMTFKETFLTKKKKTLYEKFQPQDYSSFNDHENGLIIRSRTLRLDFFNYTERIPKKERQIFYRAIKSGEITIDFLSVKEHPNWHNTCYGKFYCEGVKKPFYFVIYKYAFRKIIKSSNNDELKLLVEVLEI